MKFRSWAWLIAFASLQAPADDSIMDVVTLQNRPATEIDALIRPMLDADDRIVADGFSLIIKARAERMEDIRRLIRQLDKRQQNLVISVMQDSYVSAEALNAQAAVRISNKTAEMRGFVADTRDLDELQTTQKIRTREGEPAHIRAGQVRTVDQIVGYGYPYGNVIVGTQPVEATTGFAVVPRLTDDQGVMIDIAPWSDRFLNNGALAIHDAQTSIRARLGEWVEIASSKHDSSNRDHGFNSFNATTDTGARYILIKVDLND